MKDIKCCGKTPVRSNSEFFGRWMCPSCNQLFDRTWIDGSDENGEFIATGMFSTREEQEKTKVVAKALSHMLGHHDVWPPDLN